MNKDKKVMIDIYSYHTQNAPMRESVRKVILVVILLTVFVTLIFYATS